MSPNPSPFTSPTPATPSPIQESGRGRRRGAIRHSGCPAQKQECGSFILLTRIVERCADEHVVEAVAVHVSRTGNAAPELGARLVRLDPRLGRARSAIRNSRRTAQKQECDALVLLARIVERRRDDHVVEAIAIDVSRSGDAGPQEGERLIRFDLGRGRARAAVGDSRRAPQEDERGSFVFLACIEEGGPDDHVRISVAVHVAGIRDAPAELSFRLIRFEPGIRDAAEQGIDFERVGRLRVGDDQPDVRRIGHVETGRHPRPVRIHDFELAIPQPPPGGRPKHDLVPVERCRRMPDLELEDQRRAIPGRTVEKRESLLEPECRILVPLRDARSSDLDPSLLALHEIPRADPVQCVASA
jgi:hypothetical protein